MDNTVRKAHNSLSDDELVIRCKSKKMIYCGRGKMDGETSIDFYVQDIKDLEYKIEKHMISVD